MAKPRKIMILFRVPVVGPRGRPFYTWKGPPVELVIGQPPLLSAIVGINQYGAQFRIVDASVVWSSSDPSIATLQTQPDGSVLVTPIASGTITLTARFGSLTDTASLAVTQGVPIRIAIVFPAA